MRAPVYRAIDNANTVLGLAFPSEVLVVLTVYWATALTLSGSASLLGTLGTYVGLRVATLGKPTAYLQHRLLFAVRGRSHAGRYSPAARAMSAFRQFPFSPRRARDVQPLKGAP